MSICAAQVPRPQTSPVTYILDNKRPLFGLILVHVGVLGKRGTVSAGAPGVGAVQGEELALAQEVLGWGLHTCWSILPRMFPSFS